MPVHFVCIGCPPRHGVSAPRQRKGVAMLELELVEYRVVYQYSSDIKIEIVKIGLDWAWVVYGNGEVLRADTGASESVVEKCAVAFARGCEVL